MAPRLVPGTANRPLAVAVAGLLGPEPVRCDVERFPDGELRPVVEGVRGEDVYVLQPTGPPVNEHLVELLLILDACRRAGAERITAVVPYFGYARQDRRLGEGQAVTARVCVDALTASGADRLVVVDPHTAALEAMGAIPVEMLTAVPVVATVLADLLPEGTVVVAPDLGAVKLAERYAARLGVGIAVVRKVRVSGETVRARDLIGDVAGRPSVIVDDMISTGATIEAAVTVLRAHGGGPDVTVAATHGFLVPGAADRVADLGVHRLLLTDSVVTPGAPPAAGWHAPLEVCSVAPLLADAIGRLHRNEPIAELRLSV